MNRSVVLFRALGSETRFRILELLLANDLCVGALSRRVGLSEAAVSQHLKVLRTQGLVTGLKRGYWTHYTVERQALRLLGEELAAMAKRERPSTASCFGAIQPGGEPSERRNGEMCCTDCCERPEKLKGKPEECSPEQVKQCHGDVMEHPCEIPKEQKKRNR